MNRLPLLVALALWLVPSSLCAQGLPEDLEARVDSLFASWLKPDAPGCTVAVFQDGKVAFAKGYGLANLEHAIPNTPATVFDIGSTSKQFTAACVALLVLDGKLTLDDDVRKYVPELPSYGAPITVRHLLHHTSGLRDYLPLLSFSGIDDADWTTNADALEILTKQKRLCFSPGAKHEYSNSGYCLLSVIVERAGGRPFAAFAQERIFAPLGMTDTHVHDDHTRIVPRRATGYAPKDDGGFEIAMSNFEQTGDGAVLTTVLDLAKWDESFYSGQVGGQGLLDLLAQRGRLGNGKEIDYGFGLTFGKHAGLPMVSHGGAWAGYRAELVRFPTKHLSVVCLANVGSADASGLALDVADLALGRKPGLEAKPTSRPAAAAPAYTPTAAELEAHRGHYLSLVSGRPIEVRAQDGSLYLTRPGMTVELTPLAKGRFQIAGKPIEILFPPVAPGKAARFLQKYQGVPATAFEAFTPWSPESRELAVLVGCYRGDEVGGAILTLRLESGKLLVSGKHLGDGALLPTAKDTFLLDGGMTVKVKRKKDGEPYALGLTMRGLTDLRFVKVKAK
jgi:CubicO group peptidase (beta-lactamase class C family)